MSMTLEPPFLISCDREAIHAPGSIQPHGMMLVAGSDDLLVRHVAGDVERRLGVTAWEGQPLGALVGDSLAACVRALARSGGMNGFMGQLQTPANETLDVTAHRSGPCILVELEAASTEGLPASQVMDRAVAAAARLEQATSLLALCKRAATEFRRLTGFDRVMVYQFLDDDSGKVLAQDKRDDLQSFYNHHFPASDIPRQARALYIRNVLRVIPDASYEPAPLRPPWTGPTPLDMSDSSLRSVSPTHLHYLRNMDVQASASFSVVKDGVLWGMVACHSEAPRSLTYDVRAAGRLLVGGFAQQVKAKDEAESYRQRIRLRSFEDDIVGLLSREGSLDEALSNHLDEIGRMMGGDGVAVLRGREMVVSGACPGEDDIRALGVWLTARNGEPVFATDCLSGLYPAAAKFQGVGSGVLSVMLSSAEAWLLIWFREEQIETVNWAGNPHKPHGADPSQPLTPRASFEAWAETVNGRARAWSLPEVDAASRLRAALLEVQQNRRVHELNRQLTKILQDKDVLLQQKEFLIGEVNHRVQNSLLLVSSFLGLQANTSDNVELQVALQEARRRLTAVALVHRRLYRSDQIEVVDGSRYIEELCADTFSFMGEDWAKHLTLNLTPVLIATDRAVTLGLVLTELLINSNKYAYAGGPGPIEIELRKDRKNIHLVVSDKGVSIDPFRKGFGSRIMEGLVKQLSGELIRSDNQPGLRVEVIVPKQNPK